jgi:hypothetical protein
LRFPASCKPAPKPERVSFFSVYVYFFIPRTPKGAFNFYVNIIIFPFRG